MKHAADKPCTFCSFLQIVPAMDSTGCYFSDLPTELHDAVLQQAFEQLDQRHLCGIVSLVCRSWHTRAVSCSSLLDVKPKTPAAGQSLTSWVRKNGSNLKHLSVSFAALLNNDASPVPQQLLQTAVNTTLNQLKSLRFQGVRSLTLSDVQFPLLSHLTSFTLSSCLLRPELVSSLSALTQLRSLDISRSISSLDTDSMILELSTKLTGLTSLNLSHTSLWLGRGMSGENISALTAGFSRVQVLRLEGVKVPASILAQLDPQVEVPAAGITTGEDTMDAAITWLQRSWGSLEVLEIASSHQQLLALQLARLWTPLQLLVAPRLQSLKLSWCNLQGQCLFVAGLTQLKVLSLHRCELAVADLGELSALNGLHELQMVSTCVAPAAPEGSLDSLANGLANLRMLHVSDSCLVIEVRRAFRERIVGGDKWCIALRPID